MKKDHSEFQAHLKTLVGQTIIVSHAATDNGDSGSIDLTFSGGAWVSCGYWRFVGADRRRRSNFDHRQQYGRPAQIDAPEEIKLKLSACKISTASLNEFTGDLEFAFDDQSILQIFNFTGYEAWEIRFQDNWVAYSNYV